MGQVTVEWRKQDVPSLGRRDLSHGTGRRHGRTLARVFSAFVVVVACTVVAPDARALTIDTLPFGTNGEVLAVAQSGNTLYLGGRFTRVGPITGGALQLGIGSGAPDGQALDVAGSVSAVVSDGAGGWFIGGNFDAVDGTPESDLAHVTSAGTLDPSFVASADGPVLALATSGGSLFVGGDFVTLDGVAREHFGAVSAVSGAVLSASADCDGEVRALTVASGQLYVGGAFQHIGGVADANLAALDPTSLVVNATFAPAPDGAVDALAAGAAGTLYAGGSFANIGGQSLGGLAALDETDGSASSSFAPDPGSTVDALLRVGSVLYAGGSFGSIGGQAIANLAAVSTTDGTTSATFDPAPNGTVEALAPGAGGSVDAGGSFTQIGGQSIVNLAELDPTTGDATTGFVPDPDNTVAALAVSSDGSSLYVGGDFASAGGVARSDYAAIDLSTGAVLPSPPVVSSPGADSYVRTLAVVGSTVWIGGQFDSVGGAAHNDLAAIGTDGTTLTLDEDTDNVVQRLVPFGSSLLVGGNFESIAGTPSPALAEIDPTTGAVASTFASSFTGGDAVYAIAPLGNTVYVGGSFGDAGGSPASDLAALSSTDGSRIAAFEPDEVGANGPVVSLDATPSALFVGGQFSSLENVTTGTLGAVDPTTGAPITSFDAYSDGEVDELVTAAGEPFATGCFENWDGQPLANLTGFDPSSGAALDPGFTMFNTLFGYFPANSDEESGCGLAIAQSSDGSTIYVGGLFTSVADEPQGGITSFSTATADSGSGSGSSGSTGSAQTTVPIPASGGTSSPAGQAAQSLPDSESGTPGPAFVIIALPRLASRATVNTGVTASCPAGGAACVVTVKATSQPAAPDKAFAMGHQAVKKKTTKKKKPVRPRSTPPTKAGSRTLTIKPGRKLEITFVLSKAAQAVYKRDGDLTLDAAFEARAKGAASASFFRPIILEAHR